MTLHAVLRPERLLNRVQPSGPGRDALLDDAPTDHALGQAGVGGPSEVHDLSHAEVDGHRHERVGLAARACLVHVRNAGIS
jgi:hypothetical protein